MTASTGQLLEPPQQGDLKVTEEVCNNVADTGEVECKVGTVHTARRTATALTSVSIKTPKSCRLLFTQFKKARGRFAGKPLKKERNSPCCNGDATHDPPERPGVGSDGIKKPPEKGERSQFDRPQRRPEDVGDCELQSQVVLETRNARGRDLLKTVHSCQEVIH